MDFNMKKLSVLLMAFVLVAVFAAGCLDTPPPAPPAQSPASPTQSSTPPTPGDGLDAITSASPKESGVPADIINGLADSGFWIFAILSDVTIDGELVVSGEFHQRDDPDQPIYRKLALYAQDADRNVTADYVLTVPLMTVKSPNFRIQNGVVKGDIVVDADGFELSGGTLQGNLTFKTQAQMDSAKLDEGTVTGTVSVG